MNLFPVDVTIRPAGHTGPATVHASCRLVWDGARTAIWEWPSRASSPVLLADVEGAPLTEGKSHTITTPDGAEVVAVESQHCGCSHRLKHFTPKRPVRVFTTPDS